MRYRLLAPLLGFAALLLTDCEKDNPKYCGKDRPCPMGLSCDPTKNSCVVLGCETLANCQPSAPICDAQKKECRTCQTAADDADCKVINPTTPFCHTASGACVACRESGDCKEADRPICDAGIPNPTPIPGAA